MFREFQIHVMILERSKLSFLIIKMVLGFNEGNGELEVISKDVFHFVLMSNCLLLNGTKVIGFFILVMRGLIK
jgi:hypothetical protein